MDSKLNTLVIPCQQGAQGSIQPFLGSPSLNPWWVVRCLGTIGGTTLLLECVMTPNPTPI